MNKTYLMAITALVLILSQTAESATVDVNLNTANQTIRGFGGMNFPRWGHGLQNDAQVDTAFGNGPGQIGLTIMRIDISPSQSDWGDTAAAAQRAINNHGAIVFASPWSPPASMKTNNNLIQGELKTDSYDDFANWLIEFANHMSDNGVPLFAVSVQNEPDWLPDYESCGYSPTQMQTFLNNNASVIPTRVIAPECVHYKEDYVSAVASSPECDIVAVHAYGGTITYYSDKEYWMTEHYTDSTNNGNLWPNALEVGEEIHNCMAANMNAYIWWYIRRFYGPMEEDGSITKRGYCMSHFAKFARPGYIRVDATDNPSSGVYVTAYKNDANLVIVAINQNSSSSDVTFSLSGGIVSSYTKYETSSSNSLANMGSVGSTNTLAAYSINTFVGTIDVGPTNTLTCSSTTGGDVTTPGEGDFQYAQDSYASIAATPDQYYHFVNWTGTAVTAGKVADPDAASTTVLMDANYTVVANFEANPPDTTPPTPDPMTWSSAPAATGPSTITMTATTATDSENPPVQYYFECTNDASKSSAWQSSTTYVATGLTPSTQYSFRVQARDSALTPNVTAFSTIQSATTEPPPTNVEIIGDWVTGTTHAKEAGYSRALIFIAHEESVSGNPYLSSVTYGGQTMTKVIEVNAVSSGYGNYTAAFILNETGIAAATGNPPSFTPTWSGTTSTVAYSSVFLQNVDQMGLVGDSDKYSTTSSTPNPITTPALVTNDGDMVIYGVTCGNLGNYNPNNGFTEGTDQQAGTSGHTGETAYKPATGAAETPSATYNTGPNRQAIIGFVVQAAAAIIDDPPAAPTGLTATDGDNIVWLDWNDNTEPDLAGYNVYRSTTQGSGYSLLNGSLVADSNYVDTTVTNDITYYYVVTAVDAGDNESIYSSEVSATPGYQTCAEVQDANLGLLSDLNGDCYVDELDLWVVADYWLHTDCVSPDDCAGGDFEPDGDVDFADFSDFGLLWLECNDPQNPDCPPNW